MSIVWRDGTTKHPTHVTNVGGSLAIAKDADGIAGLGVRYDVSTFGGIQEAIDAAAGKDNGIVYLPPGTYTESTTLTVPAGVSLVGAGVDVSIINFTGSGPAIEGSASWYHQRFQDLTVTIENNTNANTDILDAYYGANTCLFSNIKLITTATYGRHGLIIRGVSSGANNAQYNNTFINVRTLTADTDAGGIGLYLYGQDVTNARCNSNQVIGGILDGFNTGCYINGNGNHIIGTTFNGPAATAALHLYGDNGCVDNTVSAYFDAGISGDKIRLELTTNAVCHMLGVHGGRGIKSPSDIVLTGSYTTYIYYSLFTRGVWPGSVDSDALTSVDSQVYAGADDAGFVQYMGGRDWASAKIIAAGKNYAGSINAVSPAGGLSANLYSSTDAEFRIVKSADGSSFTKLFVLNSDGEVVDDFEVMSEGVNNIVYGTVYSSTYVPTFVLRRTRGTKASPSQILSGNQVGRIYFAGARDTTPNFGTGAKITAYATEDIDAAGYGMKLVLAVASSGATSTTDILTVDEDGITLNTAKAISMTGTGADEAIIACEATADSVTADPTTDAPNGWLEFNVGGNTRYVPYYTIDGA